MFEKDEIINTCINGDALEVLKQMPDAFVDCCITSPPYYGLRDYGMENQIGMEETQDTTYSLREIRQGVRHKRHLELWLAGLLYRLGSMR